MLSLTKREQVIVGVAIILAIACIGTIMLNYNRNEPIEINVGSEIDSSKKELIEEDKASANQNEDNKRMIYVHVKGQVNNAGVVELEEGKRVIDAIKLAGGETEESNTDAINLAAVLKDGQEIYVPSKSEDISQISSQQSSTQSSKTDGKININTADLDDLQKLPGIGPTTAKAIIEFRDENNSFKNIEDIMNVPGIASGKFSKIKDLIETY